jgi:hypothetical protein
MAEQVDGKKFNSRSRGAGEKDERRSCFSKTAEFFSNSKTCHQWEGVIAPVCKGPSAGPMPAPTPFIWQDTVNRILLKPNRFFMVIQGF